MKLISAKDAAEKLGVSDRRIRAMIKEGKIKAVNVGGGYVIEEKELENVVTFGKPGRPQKSNGIKAVKEAKK
jgi:excisionase family DNA binding protein